MINQKVYDNRKNIYFFFKGRIALFAILKAIGLNKDDEVILPGFTCVVVPNAIIYLGGKPVYVDISPENYNIDPSKIEEKITKKTRAVIAQHTFGIPADMVKILEIAKKNNLIVIEDSCHALGSKYNGLDVGTFGDAAFFSSQWSKPVTTGLGGWAIVNNLELKERIDRIYPQFIQPASSEVFRLKIQYLIYSKLFRPSLFWFIQDAYRIFSRFGIMIGSSTNTELKCEMPNGYKKKMSDWQKDLLLKKLNDLEKVLKHRKWLTSLYQDQLRQRGIKIMSLPENYDPVLLRYPLLVKNKIKVISEARQKRIEIGDWFVSPIHPNLENWERIRYRKGTCPIAEEICENIVNLPTHYNITEEVALNIVNFISTKVNLEGIKTSIVNTKPHHVRN